MKKTALVIMAAGIGSRFGKEIKQLAPVGPSGEIIMDYSIADAIEAGFNKVIFIIRKDLEELVREAVGDRASQYVEVEYVFQDPDDLPAGFQKPQERTKPWGTGQAVLAIRDVIDCPFVVINADDYYGKEGFKKLHTFLVENDDPAVYCMAGFVLGNTLSENGTVTRGVCQVSAEGYLEDVNETSEIAKNSDGIITCERDGKVVELPEDAHVSMNMWGFYPEFIETLKVNFVTFLDQIKDDDLKSEYLLPTVVADSINSGKAKVKVLESKDKWFGVTYAEDKPVVIENFKTLVEQGMYKTPLF
jgi:NDP-sugar pyrophosphorylase family protein